VEQQSPRRPGGRRDHRRVLHLRGRGAAVPAGPAPARPVAERPSHSTRERLRRLSAHGDDGFTLVELLVVVLVIGALVGIAVPTFVKQRDGAWDAAVRSELRAATIALASYRAQNGIYSSSALATGAGWGFEPSPDVVTLATIAADQQGFCVRGWYRTSVDTAATPTTTDADARAEWAATPTGIVELTGTPRACPS